MNLPEAMKRCTTSPRRHPGFTLAEVALTIGIIAGTALVVVGLVVTLTHNVRRLKAPEAKPRVIADSQSAPPDNGLPDEGRPECETQTAPAP